MKKGSLLFLIAIASIYGYGQLPPCNNNFVVIAHRGNHINAPENTLLAIQHAINVGADYVEIDLRTSKDGELVIMHDRTVDRTTNKKENLNAYTLEELRTLKIQEKHIQNGEITKYPLLWRFYASVKKAFLQILAIEMQNQVIVYINNEQQFKDWRTIAPKIPLILSLTPEVKTRAKLEAFFEQYKPDILDGNYHDYTKELVKAAQDKNIPVWPDIQSENENVNWEIAISTGLSRLQTDQPEALIAFLKARDIR
ncbi:glycerophosphodiester phosphodiesterase [Arcticibacterium luteifluviistationis]|uniref:GP-PDE domain-containing protein n=1 Tax=Arcticibacterium luteifluviistationis TaxID=1784714 RepID=A0A2Z4GBK9_9BACT|nr:glycerophosphodiester phosphodiesterase family protein [Arcticibacterium luteifluviistationis]AWV98445.1 hypothetical protein DJ013_09765 [Arcticibacterium luteifluviistationis]